MNLELIFSFSSSKACHAERGTSKAGSIVDGSFADNHPLRLGAKCCDVFAHFVGGNENSLPENHRRDA